MKAYEVLVTKYKKKMSKMIEELRNGFIMNVQKEI